MDWRSIGSSYTPALEAREVDASTTAQPYALKQPNDNAKPPKYNRWLYVVGISQEDQEAVLEALEEVAGNGSRGSAKKPELAIQDITEQPKRYYTVENGAELETEIIQERTMSLKNLQLDPCVTPSMDAWLRYIRAKASELVAKLQHNKHNVPEWMLARITEDEELIVVTQNCELLHKLSSIYKRAGQLEWRGKTSNAAVAYLFTIILFYKKLLVPKFDNVMDAVKWIKSWSNDYIRINGLRHEIPVNIHQAVSTEPVYWRYIASTIMTAKLTHNRFTKVINFFFRHLRGMMDMEGAPRDNIEKSIVVILTECLIPRLLAAGYEGLAVNIIRSWLGYNLFNDYSCANFGHISQHYLLYNLSLLRQKPCVDKKVLLDLCDIVDADIESDNVDDAVDYCRIKAMDLNDLPVDAIVLSTRNLEELIFRLLELFGSKSIDRVGSRSRWYNFVKSFVFNTKSAQRFLTLMLLHCIIAIPNAKILLQLLVGVCNSKDVSKKILQLHVGDPDLWTSYALLETDESHASLVYKEAMQVFPNHIPLWIAFFMYKLHQSPESQDALIDDMRTKLEEHANDEENANHKDIYQAVLDRITPSKKCADAIVYSVKEKYSLHEAECRAKWNALVGVLNECELVLLLKVICKCVPTRTAQKLAEYIVKSYSNNEDIVATNVEYAIARTNKNIIRRLLVNESTHSRLSMATKHLACFVKYTDDTMLDCAGVRLRLLGRVDDRGDALRSVIEEPMPFKIPNVRALYDMLEKIKTKYDPIRVITNNCPFSKALWLKLTEHLPASSSIIEDEMIAYGINV